MMNQNLPPFFIGWTGQPAEPKPSPGDGRPLCRTPPPLYFWALGVGFVVYVLFGAMVFSAMKLPRELRLRREVDGAKAAFLAAHRCMGSGELERLLSSLVSAAKDGVSPSGNATRHQNWDLASSLFFLVTMLITMSNGQSIPLTKEGKGFCKLYTVLGLPFTLLLLNVLVQQLMFYVHQVPIDYDCQNWGLSPRQASRFHALVVGATMASCFFPLPAATFTALEGEWDYLESLYFCFISLSSIGVDDYVPGRSRYPNLRYLYRIGMSCYLIIGLITLLVVIKTFYGLQELQLFIQLFMRQEAQDSQPGATEGNKAVAVTKSSISGAS